MTIDIDKIKKITKKKNKRMGKFLVKVKKTYFTKKYFLLNVVLILLGFVVCYVYILVVQHFIKPQVMFV